MATNFETARETLRAGAAGVTMPKAKGRKPWYEPTLDDFAAGSVLCFDQTVTKTGFSLVVRDADTLHIRQGGVLLAPKIEGLKGFEETLQRAARMARLIEAAVSLMGYGLTAIVHEMPAVMGYRIESSLMAAMAVRLAAQTHARGVPVVMVSKMSVGPVLVSPELDRLSKAEIKRSVNRLIPDYQRVTMQWTQDVSDSAALGLTHLYREKHRHDSD